MDFISWLFAALFGAGIMYLLDPQQGKSRRELLRQQINNNSKKLGEMVEASQQHREQKNGPDFPAKPL